MKIKFILLVPGFISCLGLHAQTLSPVVISSSGGFYSTTAGMLSATVGEMSMVETFTAGGSILTQGFQQPEDFNVSVKDLETVPGIALGPNPTSGIVHIIFSNPGPMKFSITVFDLAGKILYIEEIEKALMNNYVALDLSSFAAGEYILDCRSPGGTGQKISFAQKITINR